MSRAGIEKTLIGQRNESDFARLQVEYDALGEILQFRGIDIDLMKEAAARFELTVPSFGVAHGGSTMRWPVAVAGEPRGMLDRLDDLGVVNQLTGIAPRVSLSVSRDRYDHPAELRDYANARGLRFDAALADGVLGLGHSDADVRRQAIEQCLAVTGFARDVGSTGLVVRLVAEVEFPGHVMLGKTHARLLDSLRAVYSGLPANWRLFAAHGTGDGGAHAEAVPDWATLLQAVTALGDRAFAAVELGARAEANEAASLTRLFGANRLGRIHFGDCSLPDRAYGLFLALVALQEAESAVADARPPGWMVDHARAAVDPVEALMASALAVERAAIQAVLVDREVIANLHETDDALMAGEMLKLAFQTDVGPILAMARSEKGAAIEPITTYRASGYRQKMCDLRPAKAAAGLI